MTDPPLYKPMSSLQRRWTLASRHGTGRAQKKYPQPTIPVCITECSPCSCRINNYKLETDGIDDSLCISPWALNHSRGFTRFEDTRGSQIPDLEESRLDQMLYKCTSNRHCIFCVKTESIGLTKSPVWYESVRLS